MWSRGVCATIVSFRTLKRLLLLHTLLLHFLPPLLLHLLTIVPSTSAASARVSIRFRAGFGARFRTCFRISFHRGSRINGRQYGQDCKSSNRDSLLCFHGRAPLLRSFLYPANQSYGIF